MAGIELAAGSVHVVVGRREESRLRIVGRGSASIPEGAVSGGLVADRAAAADALRSAFATAEHLQRAERAVVAIDSDDMRTFHALTTFERDDVRSAMGSGEEARAVREAAASAMTRAAAAAEEDPALRGVATARLHDDVAARALDGRGLPTLTGHHGRLVDVWTDVTIASLVVTGAATSALEAARRRGTVISGAYALGRLVAASGTTDAGIVRVGDDLTSVAILREGRVTATRAFALGRSALDGRDATAAEDARVWSDCVVASLRGLDGPPPGRWLFVGVPEAHLALPNELGERIGEIRGDTVDIRPLTLALVSRIYGDGALLSEDLVAAGAAAIAAGLYEA